MGCFDHCLQYCLPFCQEKEWLTVGFEKGSFEFCAIALCLFSVSLRKSGTPFFHPRCLREEANDSIRSIEQRFNDENLWTRRLFSPNRLHYTWLSLPSRLHSKIGHVETTHGVHRDVVFALFYFNDMQQSCYCCQADWKKYLRSSNCCWNLVSPQLLVYVAP